MSNYIPQFPVSLPAMLIWLVLLLVSVFLFLQLLVRLSRKGHRHVIGGIFFILLALGTAIHVLLLTRSTHTVTDGNWIQLVMVSLIASLEMFIGQTSLYDDIIAAVIFREPGLLLAYSTIFVWIVTYSLSILLLIVPQRLRDRSWLRMYSRKARKDQRNYIFLDINRRSKALARDILRKKQHDGEVILVDFPGDKGVQREISLGELVGNIFSRGKELTLEEELGSDDFILLRGHLPADGEHSLCSAIGLEKMHLWLENPHTTLYILSDNEENNLAMLKLLVGDASIQAKIFCFGEHRHSYASLMADMNDRIHLLNPPEMLLTEVKQNHPELLPIHYVDIARGTDGAPLGYVNGGHSALLLGFGEGGQEALRYLYEFGSFVGADKQPVQNTFYVYDPDIEAIRGGFLNRTPALRYSANIIWSADPIGSSQFWMDFAMMLPTLNYVAINIDYGRKNVEIAIRLLKEAARYGKDLRKLCMLVRAGEADGQMLDMIDFYNRSFCPEGCAVIHPVGLSADLWNLDVISGKALKQKAIRYAGDAENWDRRSERLRTRGGNRLLNRQERRRRQAQDISTCLYASTLLQLCPPSLYPALEQIPDSWDGANPVHFTGSAKKRERLEYLVCNEELHWKAALEAAGYIDGGEVQDELNMKIRHLAFYDQIPDEEQRHVAWQSVKRMVTLAHEEE